MFKRWVKGIEQVFSKMFNGNLKSSKYVLRKFQGWVDRISQNNLFTPEILHSTDSKTASPQLNPRQGGW